MSNERTQVASIFQNVLTLAAANDFAAIDKLLEETEPSAMEVSVSLALLAITVRLDHKLLKRVAYYDKMKAYLDTVREPAEVKALLKGLE